MVEHTMASDTFMSRLRSFLGIRLDAPRNDFRNPIWGSDDDDDGDELYTRTHMDVQSQLDLHRELAKQVHDMFSSFGGMFGLGDMRTFFNDDVRSLFGDDHIDTDVSGEISPHTDHHDSNSIRDYYLKPGYYKHIEEPKDADLDGKISSHDISGLLKKNDEGTNTIVPFDGSIVPFDGSLVPGRSFCQTIITTSITKPDGTIETRKIVKNGNEVIEETTTSSPDPRSPYQPGLNPISSTGIILSELGSLFKNFY